MILGLNQTQQLKLGHQLTLTPQLQMSIKLLQLSRVELVDAINIELEKNPTLEESHDEKQSEQQSDFEYSNKEANTKEETNNDIDWSDYINEYNSRSKVNFEAEKQVKPSFESFIACKESLIEHLLWQLLMTSPTPEEEKIGSIIAGNLDSNGFLTISFEELVSASAVSVEKVKQVLSLMQTFDPIGVCANNLKESLLTQAKHLKLDSVIVSDIIKKHLHHLETKKYKVICDALSISIDDVIDAVDIIKTLEPRPGRQFSDEYPHHIIPDIFIYKLENDFVIALNDDGLPKLRINSFYKDSMRRDKKVPDTTKNYVQEKLNSAAWFIKSIHQRQKTIHKVTRSILQFQKDFFEKGVEHLKPMTLKDVAQDINMHESTVSRVTTNKYAHTPRGIFELKYFFNTSVKCFDGGVMASIGVQEKIKQIILNEDSKKPYSDDKIVELLKKENIKLARRTVAKYRETMNLLSSTRRKQF